MSGSSCLDSLLKSKASSGTMDIQPISPGEDTDMEEWFDPKDLDFYMRTIMEDDNHGGKPGSDIVMAPAQPSGSCEPIWSVTAAGSNRDQSTCPVQSSAYIDNHPANPTTSPRMGKRDDTQQRDGEHLDLRLHFINASKYILDS